MLPWVKTYLSDNRPSLTDVSAFGMLQPMAKWPMRTPVANYIQSRPRLCAWLDWIEHLKRDERLAA